MGALSRPENIGIVVGLACEARCFPATLPVRCGMGADAAYANARSLIDAGAQVLISAGLAGGLDPACRPGTVVVARAILAADQKSLPCDSTLTDSLVDLLSPHAVIKNTTVWGDGDMVTTATDKTSLHNRSGAGAVDMESYAIAHAAREAGKPFATLRVICDESTRSLPRTAQGAIGKDGSVRVRPLLGTLLRHPGDMVQLAGLAVRTYKALGVLRQCGAALGEATMADTAGNTAAQVW